MTNELITVVAKISFFGPECGSVEYTCEAYCETVAQIGVVEAKLLEEQRQYCYERDGMMDTFYYETYYEIPSFLFEAV